MEIDGPLTEWLLEHLERASPESFQGSARAISEWVFGRLMGERELKEVRALLDRPAREERGERPPRAEREERAVAAERVDAGQQQQ